MNLLKKSYFFQFFLSGNWFKNFLNKLLFHFQKHEIYQKSKIQKIIFVFCVKHGSYIQ
jgi:hypothetical protein